MSRDEIYDYARPDIRIPRFLVSPATSTNLHFNKLVISDKLVIVSLNIV